MKTIRVQVVLMMYVPSSIEVADDSVVLSILGKLTPVINWTTEEGLTFDEKQMSKFLMNYDNSLRPSSRRLSNH